MKHRDTLGYRQLCMNAHESEILHVHSHQHVRLEIIDANAVRRRFGETPDESRGTHALAIYHKDTLIDCNLASDDLSDQTSNSVQFLMSLCSRILMRTLLHRYVTKGLVRSEETNFQHELLDLIKKLLPKCSVVDTTLPQGMHWFNQFVTLIDRAVGPVQAITYHLPVTNGSALISRALTIHNPRREIQMVTKITLIVNAVPDTKEHTLRSQKMETVIRNVQPLTEFLHDDVLTRWCQNMVNTMGGKQFGMVMDSYDRQQTRKHGKR